jgi:hypothetical protein
MVRKGSNSNIKQNSAQCVSMVAQVAWIYFEKKKNHKKLMISRNSLLFDGLGSLWPFERSLCFNCRYLIEAQHKLKEKNITVS